MRCPQKTVLPIIVHLSYRIWNAGLLAHPWRMRLCSQQKPPRHSSYVPWPEPRDCPLSTPTGIWTMRGPH